MPYRWPEVKLWEVTPNSKKGNNGINAIVGVYPVK